MTFFQSKKLTNKKMAIAYALVIFLLIIDRFFKTTARLFLVDKPIHLTNYFDLNYFLNKNIAFSLPLSGPLSLLFICLILLFTGYLSFWYFSKKQSTTGLLFSFISLSAISNILDRFLYGGVIDYFNFANFTVLNIPDIIISTAAILLFISILTKKS